MSEFLPDSQPVSPEAHDLVGAKLAKARDSIIGDVYTAKGVQAYCEIIQPVLPEELTHAVAGLVDSAYPPTSQDVAQGECSSLAARATETGILMGVCLARYCNQTDGIVSPGFADLLFQDVDYLTRRVNDEDNPYPLNIWLIRFDDPIVKLVFGKFPKSVLAPFYEDETRSPDGAHNTLYRGAFSYVCTLVREDLLRSAIIEAQPSDPSAKDKLLDDFNFSRALPELPPPAEWGNTV